MPKKKEPIAKTEKETDSWRSHSWFIVLNNPRTHGFGFMAPEEMENLSNQEICDVVVDMLSSKTKQAACLYCVSAAGLEHLHIVNSGFSAIKFNTIRNILGSAAHLNPTRGTREQVEAYINKTGKWEEKGEVVLAKAIRGEIQGKQGQRTDIELIRKAVDEGLTWKEVVRLNDKFYDSRMMTHIKNLYYDKRNQETLFKRNIAVHWVMGDSGSGKTGITIDMEQEHGEGYFYLVSTDYTNPWDDYSGEPVLVLNEYRGQFKYSEFLSYLEGYKIRLRARYTNSLSLWNEVYVTTIKTPEQVYSKMVNSEEAGEDPIGQLMSRITDISYCYKVNRPTGTKTDRDGNPCEFYRYVMPGKIYRELKATKTLGTKEEQLKNAAKLDYMINHQQASDTVECFDIKPTYK